MKDKIILLWGKLEKIQLDKKKIIAIVLVGILFLYLDFTCIKLQLNGLRTNSKKAAKLKNDLSAFERDFANMDKDKKAQANILSKVKQIISQDQKGLLSQDIYDLANKYQIKIFQLKPSVDARAKEEVVGNTRLIVMLIEMSLSSGYHELGSFINALENGKYLVAVNELRIKSNPNDTFRHDVNLTLKAYVKK